MNSIEGSRNPKEQRRDNAYRVLNIIREDEGKASRKVLSQKAGLSLPSVNDIVNYLQNFRLIHTSEMKQGRGKTVPLYKFHGSHYAVLGLTIYPGRAIGVCTDLEGNLRENFFIKYEGDVKGFSEEIQNNLEKLITNVKNAHVLSLGIGYPGLIDYEKRTILYSHKFPELEKINFAEDLENTLQIPCFVDHNPNLSAFAASKIGIAQDLDNFLFIILDKGIGGSLVYRGRVFRGNSSFIGEMGHSTVGHDGAQCLCGNRGCLEANASSEAIRWTLAQCESKEEKDTALQSLAEQIGQVVGNLICFLGIGNVVFGGISLRENPDLFYRIRQVLLLRTMPVFRPKLDIRQSMMDINVASRGAALWAGEIALSNLNSYFFGNRAPDLPLKKDYVRDGALNM